MLIKPAHRLVASDLPLIESPWFASRQVKGLLAAPPFSVYLDSSLVNNLSGRPQPNNISERLANAELFLVYSHIERNRLFSPLITWQADSTHLANGYWRINDEALLPLSQIKSAVDTLNKRGLTPEDLNFADTIGGLSTINLDMEIRNSEAEQRRHAESENTSNSEQILGASSRIASLSSAIKSTQPESAPLNIVVGLFLDGTLNNVDNVQAYRKRVEDECVVPLKEYPEKLEECQTKLRLRLGESYANAPTNVVKLFGFYQEGDTSNGTDSTITLKAYEAGAGTKSGGSDSLEGMATGLGDTGIPSQIRRIFSKLAIQIKDAAANRTMHQVTIDIFGFSRGAAAARHAANEILKGASGGLGQALRSHQISWPESVCIRFLGLFDTVAGIVNFSTLDLSPSNDRNNPVELYIDSSQVEHVVHLVAKHERRANFALNSIKDSSGNLPPNFREITLPGAHSDVGGGYHELQTEEVLLNPSLHIRGSATNTPHQTMEWDNLHALKQQVDAEGWIGKYSLPLPDGTLPTIALEETYSAHPSPDGQVTLSLRMRRQVKGEYSRISLRLMYLLAKNAGVSLKPIPANSELDIPEDLNPVYQHLREEVTEAMNNYPELDSSQEELVKQRYVHHSDHYNLLEGILFSTVARFEFPFDDLAPFRPTSSRERTTYPNQEPERSP